MVRRSKSRNRVRVAAKERSATTSGIFNSSKELNFFNPKNNTYLIDIVPYEVREENHPDSIPVGDLWYVRPYERHHKVGPNEEHVVCPKSIGKPCPICEYRNQLFEDDAGRELTDPLRPQKRELYNVHILNHEEYEPDTPYLMDVSFSNFGAVLTEEIDASDDEEAEIFFELDIGVTLKVRFKQDSFGQFSYYKASKIDFKEKRENGAYDDSELDNIYPLDDILVIKDYDEIYEILHGESGSSNKDDDKAEDDAPDRSKRSAPKAEKKDDDESGDDEEAKEDSHEECQYFGECEKHDVCQDCDSDLWEKCSDQTRRNRNAQRKTRK